jgi:hypothetical protein
MSQTMLAILALMLVTLFAFQQQRNIGQARVGMMRNEIAVQAMSVAVDRLEQVGVVSFDEATLGDAKITAAGSLTPGPPFAQDTQGNDIDDFHGGDTTVTRYIHGKPMPFRVETTVAYAAENDPEHEVSFRTRFKKATARAYALNVGIAIDTATVSQTFACGSLCDW